MKTISNCRTSWLLIENVRIVFSGHFRWNGRLEIGIWSSASKSQLQPRGTQAVIYFSHHSDCISTTHHLKNYLEAAWVPQDLNSISRCIFHTSNPEVSSAQVQVFQVYDGVLKIMELCEYFFYCNSRSSLSSSPFDSWQVDSSQRRAQISQWKHRELGIKPRFLDKYLMIVREIFMIDVNRLWKHSTKVLRPHNQISKS